MKLIKIINILLLSGSIIMNAETPTCVKTPADKKEKKSIKEEICSLIKKHKQIIIATTTGILTTAAGCYMWYKKYDTLNVLHLFNKPKEEAPLYYGSDHVPFIVSEKEEMKLDRLYADYEQAIKNGYSAKRKFQAHKKYCEYIIELSEKYWKADTGIRIVYQAESWARSVENNIRQFSHNLNELDISSTKKDMFIGCFNDTTFNSLSIFEDHIEKLGLDKHSPKIVQNLRSLFHESLIEKELLRRLVK